MQTVKAHSSEFGRKQCQCGAGRRSGVRVGRPGSRKSIVDRIELAQIILCLPESDIQVGFGEYLLDVLDVRYSAERESVVLLLHAEDVRDVLRRPRI